MSIINKKITNVPIAQFETNIAAPLASLTLPLSPVQSFNGYDGPWPGGAGKNKLPNTEKGTSTGSGVTWVPNDIGEVACTGTPTANTYKNYGHVVLPAGTYTVTGIPETAPITGSRNAGLRVTKGAYTYGSDADLLALISFPTATSGTFTIEEEADVYLRLYVYTTSGTITDFVFKPMIRLSSEADDTWEPYENICPISGWTGANVTVSPTTTGGTVYPVTWSEAGTVYSGEVDIVSGELTVDTMMVTLTGEESAARYVWDAYSLTVPGLVDVNNEVNVIACSHTDTFITGLRMSDTSATDEYPVAVCTSAGPRVRFRNREAGNTLEEYRAWLQAQNSAGTPVQVVARLASPQTYQLTPTQVMTLLGVNNVWSDTGNITLEYSFRVFDITKVKINGTDITDYIAFQGLKRGRNDVESPNAGRTLDAVMHRGRVATKLRWDVTCRPLTSQELAILENLIMPETVNVTIEGDPYYDTWTRRCYANNTSASYLILKPDGRQLWGGITFPIIEV